MQPAPRRRRLFPERRTASRREKMRRRERKTALRPSSHRERVRRRQARRAQVASAKIFSLRSAQTFGTTGSKPDRAHYNARSVLHSQIEKLRTQHYVTAWI